MSSPETSQHPLAPTTGVGHKPHLHHHRPSPTLIRPFLEDRIPIDIPHNHTLKTPLLQSNSRSFEDPSQNDRPFSQKSSSYNDIEEIMTPETKKIAGERESIVEKSKKPSSMLTGISVGVYFSRIRNICRDSSR